jgi:hypothetical protein
MGPAVIKLKSGALAGEMLPCKLMPMLLLLLPWVP